MAPPPSSLQLYRFEADIDPRSGEVLIKGYWKAVGTIGEETIISGDLETGFIRSYPSLSQADLQALSFPGFSELAIAFTQSPFTAFAQLLEAIREAELTAVTPIENIPPYTPPTFE